MRIKWRANQLQRERALRACSVLCFIQSIFLAFYSFYSFFSLSLSLIFFSFAKFCFTLFYLFIYNIFFFFFGCWFVWKLWILRLTRWDSGLVKETTVPWSRPALIVAADFLTHVAWIQLHVFGPDFQPRPRGREATTLRIEL